MTYALYTVSLDLGQARDYSALSIIEQQVYFSAKTLAEYPWHGLAPGWSSPADMTTHQLDLALKTLADHWEHKPPLNVRHLERFPLNTGYPEIVRRVKELMGTPLLQAKGATLVLDLTGVGRPVYDLFRESGLKPVGVTITGGDTASRDAHGFRVPKRDLVSVVSTGLQSGRLSIAASLPLADTLVKELLNFRVTIDPKTAHDSYSAWRESDHDDLVLSVSMGVWYRDRLWRQHDRQRIKPTAANVG